MTKQPINQVHWEDIEIFRDHPDLDVYQELATRTAIYPGKGTPIGLIYATLKACGETGELAEHVGKAMRDDNLVPVSPLPRAEWGPKPCIALLDGELTLERRQAIIKECGDKLWYISAICNELGITLSEVAYTNLKKLAKRYETDTLQGSGDNREDEANG